MPTTIRTLSMVEARDQLTRLPEQFEQDVAEHTNPPAIKVTRRNKPVLAILSWDLYEAIMETLEILGDDEQMLLLRQGLLEAAAEEGIAWKAAKKELGWDKNNPSQDDARQKKESAG